MRLHARLGDDGEVRETTLTERDGALRLRLEDGKELAVPRGAVEGIFQRYGKPLTEDVAPSVDRGSSEARSAGDESRAIWVRSYRGSLADERTAIYGGRRLSSFRFRGFGSVHPSDWLLLEGAEGAETLAVPAPLFTAALTALARAAAAAPRGQRSPD